MTRESAKQFLLRLIRIITNYDDLGKPFAKVERSVPISNIQCNNPIIKFSVLIKENDDRYKRQYNFLIHITNIADVGDINDQLVSMLARYFPDNNWQDAVILDVEINTNLERLLGL